MGVALRIHSGLDPCKHFRTLLMPELCLCILMFCALLMTWSSVRLRGTPTATGITCSGILPGVNLDVLFHHGPVRENFGASPCDHILGGNLCIRYFGSFVLRALFLSYGRSPMAVPCPNSTGVR
eukprot:14769870-Heterocapsa_arctica.AAC.1